MLFQRINAYRLLSERERCDSCEICEVVEIKGEPYEIGYALGELARPVFADYMAQSSAWRAVSRWRGASFVALRDAARVHFPALLTELEGMAAGLRWPVEDVLLWNCRGELIHHVPDGCTTLAAIEPMHASSPITKTAILSCASAVYWSTCSPSASRAFVSFYYPCSLPGHTFAANRAGLVQTINNLRIRTPTVGVPRMILARAVLDAGLLDEALHTLRTAPAASGFHHTLGCAGDPRVFSVEATAQRCSVQSASARAPVTRII